VPRLSQTRAYVALLLIAALWGTFPATSKLALDDLPPTLLTALRAIVASAFLVVLLLRSGADAVRAPAPETVRAFFVLGVAGVCGGGAPVLGAAAMSPANSANCDNGCQLAIPSRQPRSVERKRPERRPSRTCSS